MRWIEERLKELADTSSEYRTFNTRIVATADPATIMGVRVPKLRKLAREVSRSDNRDAFLAELPHPWYEEYLVHAFVLNEEPDFGTALKLLNDLLPWVDNWCVSDALDPKAFNGQNPDVLLALATSWMASEHTYTRRFGISVLMRQLLPSAYDPRQLQLAIQADNGEYYVSMMVAWYLAEAMVSHETDVMRLLASGSMNPDLARMAIQKAIESRRIPDETKARLRVMRKGLKRRGRS